MGLYLNQAALPDGTGGFNCDAVTHHLAGRELWLKPDSRRLAGWTTLRCGRRNSTQGNCAHQEAYRARHGGDGTTAGAALQC